MTARAASALAVASLLAGLASIACAQGTAPAAAPAAQPATPAPAPATGRAEPQPPMVEPGPPSAVPEPKIEHLVTEDSQVRIEELRVRGITERIVVHSKIPGVGSYEIQPRDPGVLPGDDKGAGMRLFNFGW